MSDWLAKRLTHILKRVLRAPSQFLFRQRRIRIHGHYVSLPPGQQLVGNLSLGHSLEGGYELQHRHAMASAEVVCLGGVRSRGQ